MTHPSKAGRNSAHKNRSAGETAGARRKSREADAGNSEEQGDQTLSLIKEMMDPYWSWRFMRAGGM